MPFALRHVTPTTCLIAVSMVLAFGTGSGASPLCPDEQPTLQTVKDPALCASLEAAVRAPSALPLNVYEERLGEYIRNYCYRNKDAGWHSDKRLRDTGPYTMTFDSGHWTGRAFGTHSGPVIVWYSQEMFDWLKVHRREGIPETTTPAELVPDGALIVKEMYPAPAAACSGIDPARLAPMTKGAAVMIRDNRAVHDGWFWGWFGWNEWDEDWPAPASNAYPNMGFGQYCVNCHASAHDNLTFSSLRNIQGEPGEPLVYYTQGRIPNIGVESQHESVAKGPTAPPKIPVPGADAIFMSGIGLSAMTAPKRNDIKEMPSVSYDHVWARRKGDGLSGFLTSDQCLGCHDAGSTGLQFDMTEQGADKLVNLSAYGLWRTSPMGLAGRDPIFFAQVASETDKFHAKAKTFVEDACLGCHGVLGQRRFKADQHAEQGTCTSLPRATLDFEPFPTKDDPLAAFADYAGLARDGVSCVACHRMALGQEAAARVHAEPQNACLDARRAALNPGQSGFAATFSGSFDMGSGEVLNGPFANPKPAAMNNALGIRPEHNQHIQSSEVCGTCHTVRLPILRDGATIGHTYEQTTYAEWAFSSYRTGATPDGPLPLGAGLQAQSCQGCHMPSRAADGRPFASKIASIQEYSNFPQTDHTLEPNAIDLPIREGVARHTLVGLNVFLIKMAQQFSEFLGLRVQDPMLRERAVDPLDTTERAMLEQADKTTASVRISDAHIADDYLDVTVSVTNRSGHKFPSGVGFRRAFLEFVVRDDSGKLLWASGRTNAAGLILGRRGEALPSELWWQPDCSARIEPLSRRHQPHYQVIDSQEQVQIYEELAAEPEGSAARCDAGSENAGPLTTSFLSRCSKVKDNRLLPAGFLGLEDRMRIATGLGARRDLAEEAGPSGVGDDPDYRTGGGDTLVYRIPLSELSGRKPKLQARLYYQATPPYYLQDRICTSQSADTKRLAFFAANLDLNGTRAESWKLEVATSGETALPDNILRRLQ
jgi:mono/diheme cytochrome c family protein